MWDKVVGRTGYLCFLRVTDLGLRGDPIELTSFSFKRRGGAFELSLPALNKVEAVRQFGELIARSIKDGLLDEIYIYDDPNDKYYPVK